MPYLPGVFYSHSSGTVGRPSQATVMSMRSLRTSKDSPEPFCPLTHTLCFFYYILKDDLNCCHGKHILMFCVTCFLCLFVAVAAPSITCLLSAILSHNYLLEHETHAIKGSHHGVNHTHRSTNVTETTWGSLCPLAV